MCGTPTITITISASVDNPYPPSIDDGTNRVSSEDGDTNLTTLVSSGANVVFKFTGDVNQISAISNTSSSIFSSGPSSQDDGTWQGTIGKFPVGTTESYSITYWVDGKSYTQDPKIKVNK